MASRVAMVMLFAAAVIGLVSSCCPNQSWGSQNQAFLSASKFSRDLVAANQFCNGCGLQLCTLEQMQVAYLLGYRSEQWGLFSQEGYDVRATECANYVGREECYVVVDAPGAALSGFIPRTPRPAESTYAYCCGKSE